MLLTLKITAVILLCLLAYCVWKLIMFFVRFGRQTKYLCWNNVANITKHGVTGDYIIEFENGLRFIGYSTVWYTYPEFRRIDTFFCRRLLEIFKRFEANGKRFENITRKD